MGSRSRTLAPPRGCYLDGQRFSWPSECKRRDYVDRAEGIGQRGLGASEDNSVCGFQLAVGLEIYSLRPVRLLSTLSTS